MALLWIVSDSSIFLKKIVPPTFTIKKFIIVLLEGLKYSAHFFLFLRGMKQAQNFWLFWPFFLVVGLFFFLFQSLNLKENKKD